MIFNYIDFKNLKARRKFHYSYKFINNNRIDRKVFREIESKEKGNGYRSLFGNIKKRTGERYFNKIRPSQSLSLTFSEQSFPAYKFLIPEVLSNDWLSIVDWHGFSRDHSVHQPLTAYIVNKLLGFGNPKLSLEINGSNLLDLCVDKLMLWDKTDYLIENLKDIGYKDSDKLIALKNNKPFWKNLFYGTAVFAALFHDFGYSWQYIHKLSNKIELANYNQKDSYSWAKYIYTNFKNRLVLYPFNSYNSLGYVSNQVQENKILDAILDSLTNTHGFPGALGFLHLQDLLSKSGANFKYPINQFYIEWAALGIMMHDMFKIYKGDEDNTEPLREYLRLEIDRDPISCVLTLADVIEDFDRPYVEFTKQFKGSKMTYPVQSNSAIIEIKNDNLEISYILKDEKAYANKRKFIKKDERNYFDPINGYLDLSSIGINSVKLKTRRK